RSSGNRSRRASLTSVPHRLPLRSGVRAGRLSPPLLRCSVARPFAPGAPLPAGRRRPARGHHCRSGIDSAHPRCPTHAGQTPVVDRFMRCAHGSDAAAAAGRGGGRGGGQLHLRRAAAARGAVLAQPHGRRGGAAARDAAVRTHDAPARADAGRPGGRGGGPARGRGSGRRDAPRRGLPRGPDGARAHRNPALARGDPAARGGLGVPRAAPAGRGHDRGRAVGRGPRAGARRGGRPGRHGRLAGARPARRPRRHPGRARPLLLRGPARAPVRPPGPAGVARARGGAVHRLRPHHEHPPARRRLPRRGGRGAAAGGGGAQHRRRGRPGGGRPRRLGGAGPGAAAHGLRRGAPRRAGRARRPPDDRGGPRGRPPPVAGRGGVRRGAHRPGARPARAARPGGMAGPVAVRRKRSGPALTGEGPGRRRSVGDQDWRSTASISRFTFTLSPTTAPPPSSGILMSTPKSLRSIVVEAEKPARVPPHASLPNPLISRASVTGGVTPLIVSSPSRARPSSETRRPVERKVHSGWFSTSKKSAERMWSSRCWLFVSMERASIFAVTDESVRFSAVTISPENSRKWPRTLLTIMWRTVNETSEW